MPENNDDQEISPAEEQPIPPPRPAHHNSSPLLSTKYRLDAQQETSQNILMRRILQLKKVLLNALLLVISVAVGVLLVEVLVRVFLPEYSNAGQPKYAYDEDRKIILGKKNSVHNQYNKVGEYKVTLAFNEYGLRDDSDIGGSTENDMFVVGDSFAMGYGVEEEDRFSDLVESTLQHKVYNLAMPMTDLEGYSRLINYCQELGAPIRNLLLVTFMGNDLRDYERPPQVHFETMFSSIRGFMDKNLASYRAGLGLFKRNAPLKRWAMNLGLMTGNYEGYRSYSETIIQSSAGKLLEVAAPFNTVMIIVPHRGLWTGGNEIDESRIHTKFVQLLRESRGNVIDMRAVFEEGGQPLQYYYPEDGHWNKEGHRKTADAILDHFIRESTNTYSRAQYQQSNAFEGSRASVLVEPECASPQQDYLPSEGYLSRVKSATIP